MNGNLEAGARRSRIIRSAKRGALSRAGISLIEVLVVLVLLLVGILSVIRLFPGGFLANRRSEEQTLASRLAKQEMDRFANAVNNLMDGVVPVVPVTAAGFPGYAWRVDLDTTPDELGTAAVNVAGVDPYYYSDSDRIRRILGEQTRIPIPSPTAAGKGSIYVLSSGPIYNIPWDGQTESIFVSGSPLFRRYADMNDPNNPPLFGPTQYAVDYENHAFFFYPVNYLRQFLATYSYYDANNRVQTVVDEVITVPANAAQWYSTSVNSPMVPDSDTVGRKFVRTPPVGGVYVWSPNDPYQFDLLSANDGNFGNVGVMVFNPLGHDYTESTPNGSQPLTARIDYDVLDWHIIREDRPMPASSPYEVRLTLKNIKQLNETENDQTDYIGIFRDPSIPVNARFDVLIYDLNTGTRVPTTQYRINYKDGVVIFSDIFGQANASGNFRFFYKAHGEWALSVQKASNTYRLRNSPDVGYAEFYVPIQPADPGNKTRMYFSLMDAGKTVSIREFWYTDNLGTSHRISNEAYRINNNRANFQTLGARNLTYIDILDKHPDAVSWDTVASGQPATGVQGVSFKSRVLWTDGARVLQTSGGNVVQTRWRVIDLDTFLTRGSSG